MGGRAGTRGGERKGWGRKREWNGGEKGERREEELNWTGEGEGINAMGKRWEEGKC